jgi:hypothetical protein
MYNLIMRFYDGKVLTLESFSLDNLLSLYRQNYSNTLILAKVYYNHVFQYTIV